jgi:putative FmdB family regulatory protein
MGVLDLSHAGALALWTVAGTSAIEALATVAGSFTGGAVSRSAANIAFYSLFVHISAASTQRSEPVCYDTRRSMPIYEYQCRQCANEFELLILKGSPTPACPSCQSQDLEQLLSGFAVSSEGISQARLKTARGKLARSSQVKDQKVAEAEYFKKEREEHGGG